MARKKAKTEPPDQEAPLEFKPENIFRELCEHWTIGTLVKQAYEVIHTEDGISPVELILGETKIKAWYEESDGTTYITVGG